MASDEKIMNGNKSILEIIDTKNHISLWEERYLGSTIFVKNNGDVGVINCIGYLIWPDKRKKLRVSWATPNSQGKRDATSIKVKDTAKLDFCAFRKSDIPVWRKRRTSSMERRGEVIKEILPQIIAPTERGYNFYNKDYWVIDGIIQGGVLITADNVLPTGAIIEFNSKEKVIKYTPFTIENEHILGEWLNM